MVYISDVLDQRVKFVINDDEYWSIYYKEKNYYKQLAGKTCEIIYLPESKLIVDIEIVESP